MKLIRRMICGTGLASIFFLPPASRAEATAPPSPPPDFKEIYDLIRSHLAGESDTDLNHAAVQGLLSQLHAKVSLVAGKSETNRPDEGPLLPQTIVYSGSIAYFRVGRVGEGLAGKISSAYKELSATNHLNGVILDLRFADGHNYAEAAAAAGLFLAEEMPLLDWGNGMVRSRENANAVTLPVVVLVNQQTAAAAEALAAVLRQAAHAIILGATTAGEATIGREFPLKNGQSLRIATAGIKLADGEALAAGGLQPDIQVVVKPNNEKAWYENPFKEIPLSGISAAGTEGASGTNGTNRATHARTTEADLMRERKEHPGLDLEFSTSAGTETEPEKPSIHDPVLGRAMDLIKGISVIRQTHSP